MKLYLSGKTQIGYTPDWIRIEYFDEALNKTVELTMDIQGEIDYSTETLNVRAKGKLIPWVYYTEDNEIDLLELPEKEALKYEKLFNKYITKASNITIGLYPEPEDLNENENTTVDDKFELGIGEYYYVENDKEKHFKFIFKAEIND